MLILNDIPDVMQKKDNRIDNEKAKRKKMVRYGFFTITIIEQIRYNYSSRQAKELEEAKSKIPDSYREYLLDIMELVDLRKRDQYS